MQKNINTVAKGDAFESQVYEYIGTLLSEENFIVPGKRSQIFKKKGYYSECRKSNIVMDISIETYMPDATDYSLLTIIECKDYKRKVSIEDLEEFIEKLNQIAGKNVKGLFFTTSGFSEQCINYAKSKGLYLGVFSNGAFEQLTYRKKRNHIFSQQIENEKIFHATNGDDEYESLSKLLIKLEIIDICTLRTISVPYISKEDLSKLAHYYRKQIQDDDMAPLTIEMLSDAINKDFGITVKHIKFPTSESLGAIDVPNKRILLSTDVTDPHRTLFTLSHEAGHWFLHRQFLKDGFYSDTILDENDISRIEIQANRFASFFLIPESSLKFATVESFIIYDNPRKDRLWWDRQPCNMELARKILTRLSIKFNVSKEMLIFRLESNGMIERHFE